MHKLRLHVGESRLFVGLTRLHVPSQMRTMGLNVPHVFSQMRIMDLVGVNMPKCKRKRSQRTIPLWNNHVNACWTQCATLWNLNGDGKEDFQCTEQVEFGLRPYCTELQKLHGEGGCQIEWKLCGSGGQGRRLCGTGGKGRCQPKSDHGD